MALRVPTLADGFIFTESPRWRDGRLWFVDMHDRRVLTVDLAGRVTTIVEIDGDDPSGLGWLPDGRLLVVSMEHQRLLRVEADGTVAVHADLSPIARGTVNDMIVTDDGTAYVGDMGYRLHTGEGNPLDGQTLRVDPDGSVSVAAAGMRAPNGHVLTADESTLIVAESAGMCLTAFDRSPDGRLTNRRVYAELTPSDPAVRHAPPDGICLDAEGASWVADPIGRRLLRVLEGGAVTDVVGFGTEMPVACALGGVQRTKLFVCAAADWRRSAIDHQRTARIATIDVDVPGAGKP